MTPAIAETRASQDDSHRRVRAGHALQAIEQAEWEGRTLRRLVCTCGWASEWAAAESVQALSGRYGLGRWTV